GTTGYSVVMQRLFKKEQIVRLERAEHGLGDADIPRRLPCAAGVAHVPVEADDKILAGMRADHLQLLRFQVYARLNAGTVKALLVDRMKITGRNREAEQAR